LKGEGAGGRGREDRYIYHRYRCFRRFDPTGRRYIEVELDIYLTDIFFAYKRGSYVGRYNKMHHHLLTILFDDICSCGWNGIHKTG
ncbi:MAG: hypothetical protein M3M89_01980, partial [Thermoproteota archaeon]|nr:hypothetical protein [Thermoproteota archaeon]